MNNRIFELIQALNGIRGLLWTEEDKEELAQLIVRECIDLVPWQYEEKIKKHFGIKE